MISLDDVVRGITDSLLTRGLAELVDGAPRATPALALAAEWTARPGRRKDTRIPHVTRAQAAACARLRSLRAGCLVAERLRRWHWERLHHSVRAALIRNALCFRDGGLTPAGELVGRLAAEMLGPTALASAGAVSGTFNREDFRRRRP